MRGQAAAVVLLVLVMLAAAALPAPTASAVAAEAAPPGPRVRITTAGRRVEGVLVRVDDEVVVVRTEGRHGSEDVRIPRADVLATEVRARESSRGHGATLGATIGLVAAVIFGVAVGDSHCPPSPGPATLGNFEATLAHSLCFSRGEVAFGSALVAVPAGAVIGAVATHPEKWKPFSLAGLSVGVAVPPGGGIAGQVALRF